MTEKKNSGFAKKLLVLLIPIVVQNLLSAAVSSADVIMLSQVSQSAISAVSLANQITSILFMMYYGLGSGATALCAQYYGKRDFHAIDIVQSMAMRISLLCTLILSALALLRPDVLMRIFTNDAELIAIGVEYIRIMGVTFLLMSIIEIYLAVLRSIGRTFVGMLMHVMALVINITLNAVFIFGLFGAPKLGVKGVAIATLISRAVEFLGCVIVSSTEKEIKLRPRMLFTRNKLLFADFLRLAVPALANDISWGVAYSMYSVILGHLSTDAVAANSIVSVVRNLATVVCFGVASAAGILLGHTMGENKPEQAREEAKKLMRITVLTAVAGGLATLAASPLILRYAGSTLTDTARDYLRIMLYINTYYPVGMAVNTTAICGFFRSGGDSRFGFICDCITMWVYAVPMGFLVAFVLKLPVMWVYFLLCTDEFVKWPVVIRHYLKGNWIRNITRENIEG